VWTEHYYLDEALSHRCQNLISSFDTPERKRFQRYEKCGTFHQRAALIFEKQWKAGPDRLNIQEAHRVS
jgi:hypothetical protein